MKPFSLYISSLFTLIVCLPVQTALALFHVAVIDEVMTSWNGSPTVQFVEIRMLVPGQNIVVNSVLGVFDAQGQYIDDVLVVPANVPNDGANVRWLMGTPGFQQVTGIVPDFLIPPTLPPNGGMICWGAPGFLPPGDPTSWDHTDPLNYVDCLAYGTYNGPGNEHIGTPTPLTADGHSLQRISETEDNATDFVCADPATPTTNIPTSALLPATDPCTDGFEILYFLFESGTIKIVNVLFDLDGTFVDNNGDSGQWVFQPASRRMIFVYQGSNCNGLFVGTQRDNGAIAGLKFCLDGSTTRGAWTGFVTSGELPSLF